MIKRLLKRMLYLLPTKKVILFESYPDFSDNTMPVFNEFIKRKMNLKYKLVWICYDKYQTKKPKEKHVEYLNANNHKIKAAYYNNIAKAIVCCNRFIGSDRKDQIRFYLMHGTPVKNTSGYYCIPNRFNWAIASGNAAVNVCSANFNFDSKKIVALGYPRNDDLLSDPVALKSYFGQYSKYIVWYPTVKQFKSGQKAGSTKPIQFIYDESNARLLNEFAKKFDTLIIIKPHFAQITDTLKKYSYSNLIFIDDDFFKKNNFSSYKFVGSCDALITDYSSIYYDFTMCNKPICLIWEDIDEYKNNPGLIENYQEIMKGGEKVYTLSELFGFIERVSKNKDLLEKQRNAICEMFNISKDAQSTSRVSDFIEDAIK